MAMSVRHFRFLARGSASTSAHQSSPVGSCGCDHDRRPTASRAWGSRQVEVAILQAVAGHRQVLQPHHTSRIIIDEPEKSHSRSDPMKELTSLDRMSGGRYPDIGRWATITGRYEGAKAEKAVPFLWRRPSI
jgi:hypothetical protein